MKYNHKLKIGDFIVYTTGDTIFSISKTFYEAKEAMTEETLDRVHATGNLEDPDAFFIEPIKDINGIAKAYVVLNKYYKPEVLSFKTLSDNEIEIIEFANKSDYFKFRDEYAKEYIANYKKYEEGSADEATLKEFVTAKSWYKNLDFDTKNDSDIIDIAAYNFGYIGKTKLTEMQMTVFIYNKLQNVKQHKKNFMKSEDVVVGEYDEDGNYNVDALFNVRLYIKNLEGSYLLNEKRSIQTADENDELIEMGYEPKSFNTNFWFEKDNVTADEIRLLRKKGYKVQYVLMKYARSDDYRKKYLKTHNGMNVLITVKNKSGDYDRKKAVLHRCAYCGNLFTAENGDIDHIIPVKAFKNSEKMRKFAERKGIDGANDVDNLTFACKDCNQKKGSSTDEHWLRKGFLGRNESYWTMQKHLHSLMLIAAMLINFYLMSSDYEGYKMAGHYTFIPTLSHLVISLITLAGLTYFSINSPKDRYDLSLNSRFVIKKALCIIVYLFCIVFIGIERFNDFALISIPYIILTALMFIIFLGSYKSKGITTKID